MGKFRRATAVLTCAALTITVAACTDDRPTAEDAARTLAEGLSQLDVAQSAFASDQPAEINEQLTAITDGFAPGAPRVSVAGVEDAGDDSATATLDYVWDLDSTDQDWTYTTTTELTRVEDVWQAAWSPEVFVPDLLPDEKLTLTRVPGDRGDITGAGGEVIVTQRPVIRVGIDKTRVPEAQQAASARALAALLDLDPAGYEEQVLGAGAEAFVVALVLRDDATRTVTDEQIDGIPGALRQADTLELAPTRTFARELLGSVGEATEELVEQSDGALRAGDITGLGGLQLQHDAQLSGTPGLEVNAVPLAAPATPSQRLFAKPAVDGEDLAITLDPRLQSLGEEVLADEPSASSIVAIRPSTGEILAAANGPGSAGLQTALLGQYPPGSTFKVATSLALLREGFTPATPTACTEEVTVDGRTFNNASTYPTQFLGTIPLLETFAQSCNTGFISARDEITQADLAAAAADLGIGVPASIGTPAFFGSVPTEAEGTSHAAAMIGQGEVLVSPLALATMAASVGAGTRVTPTLLQEGEPAGDPASFSAPSPAASASAPSPDGSASASASSSASSAESAEPPVPSAFTAPESSTLKTLMAAVVAQGGAQLLQDVPGEPVLAKTGTAEFGSDSPPRTHAWVVALQGDLAVAVFVEEGELGSTSGGPLMQAFLTGAAA
ncbi:penicillin-binding transpeptidase domain-containing protein [Arthrobacter agilis]|uniref:penicillin-binding transpeptidase domain-containing protein n=1 Tax=Arthrobacter agilis TaxID=37921 RepID=UPI002366126E|nr:penicillin-binding transpeptidase domain-containing protein [Arthrobacter agilis]WDF32940.1 penicillin-binding transpeptidase domain-containing protein [Arthrobacter agilis]